MWLRSWTKAEFPVYQDSIRCTGVTTYHCCEQAAPCVSLKKQILQYGGRGRGGGLQLLDKYWVSRLKFIKLIQTIRLFLLPLSLTDVFLEWTVLLVFKWLSDKSALLEIRSAYSVLCVCGQLTLESPHP